MYTVPELFNYSISVKYSECEKFAFSTTDYLYMYLLVLVD